MTETVDQIMANLSAAALAGFESRKPTLRPFVARSANDKTEDWPFWFVADRYGINRTGYLVDCGGRQPFVSRQRAHELASLANE